MMFSVFAKGIEIQSNINFCFGEQKTAKGLANRCSLRIVLKNNSINKFEFITMSCYLSQCFQLPTNCSIFGHCESNSPFNYIINPNDSIVFYTNCFLLDHSYIIDKNIYIKIGFCHDKNYELLRRTIQPKIKNFKKENLPITFFNTDISKIIYIPKIIQYIFNFGYDCK